MKKNFSVNIHGRLFHIDEDAYELLNQYFDYLETSFQDEADAPEIIEDFKKRISDNLWLMTKHDPDHIISIHHVEKVLADLGFYADKKADEKFSGKRKAKQLFRHPDNRYLGGVCGGIAEYLKIDPLIVRIIFSLFALIFAVGILMYVIMWIIVPIASSPIERLNMSGDDITVDRVKEILRKEFSEVEKSFEKLKKKGIAKEKLSDFEHELKSFFKASVLFRTIAGTFFIVISLFIISGLVFLVFRPFVFVRIPGIELTGVEQLGAFLFDSALLGHFFKWALFLMLFIPFAGVFLYGVSLITGISIKTAVGRWISQYLGSLSLLVFVFSIAFAYINFLFLDKQQEVMFHKIPSYNEIHFELSNAKLTNSNVLSGKPVISFMPSENDSLTVVVQKRSYGRTSVVALENNSVIHFGVASDKNTIFIDNVWFSDSRLWRGQNVKVLLNIPKGRRFSVSHEFVDHFLDAGEPLFHVSKTYHFRMTENGPEKI